MDPTIRDYDAADDGTGPQHVVWPSAAMGVYRAGRWAKTAIHKVQFEFAHTGGLEMYRFTRLGAPNMLFSVGGSPAFTWGEYTPEAGPLVLGDGEALVWRARPWTSISVGFGVYEHRTEPLSLDDHLALIDAFCAIREALRR